VAEFDLQKIFPQNRLFLTIFSKRTYPRSGGILDRCTRKASFVLPSDNNGQIDSLTVICKQSREIFLAVSSWHAQITATHHYTQMWSHHGVYHKRWWNNLTLLGERRKLINTTYIGVTTFSQHLVGQDEPSETLWEKLATRSLQQCQLRGLDVPMCTHNHPDRQSRYTHP